VGMTSDDARWRRQDVYEAATLRGRDAGGATPPAARQFLRRWQIARCGDGNRKQPSAPLNKSSFFPSALECALCIWCHATLTSSSSSHPASLSG
jgi:hypothetical protein